MNVRHHSPGTKTPAKLCILLMDANSERRALRSRILTLHGVEVVGACDLLEANAIWNHERYDMVLLDIRRDYHGCLTWRDEIKRQKPAQIVAFLVGGPKYIDLTPRENSYVAETHIMEWGDSLRLAIRKSCESLPQRNGIAEAIWRISAAKKINDTRRNVETAKTTALESDLFPGAKSKPPARTPAVPDIVALLGSDSKQPEPLQSFAALMENE
jgi:CheY-like chemotaxis protein